MEHGGVDLVDCEVWTKDYIDKWSHFPYDTWPDPSLVGPHLVAVRRLEQVHRTDEFYQKFEASVKQHWDKRFELSMSSWNILLAWY